MVKSCTKIFRCLAEKLISAENIVSYCEIRTHNGDKLKDWILDSSFAENRNITPHWMQYLSDLPFLHMFVLRLIWTCPVMASLNEDRYENEKKISKLLSKFSSEIHIIFKYHPPNEKEHLLRLKLIFLKYVKAHTILWRLILNQNVPSCSILVL